MGEDQSSPSDLRTKHRRSSDEASDADRKRRKHNHHHRYHHRHHHRHRHQSMHERYGDEGEVETIIMEKRLSEQTFRAKPVDYEREEGEILDEDEIEESRGEMVAVAVEADSEVESGEIKMDLVAPFPQKKLACEEVSLQEYHLDILDAKTKKDLFCCANENDGDTGFLSDTGETSNIVGDCGDLAGDKAGRKSLVSINGPEKENHSVSGIIDFISSEKSVSPVFNDNSIWLNHKYTNDHLSRYSASASEKVNSIQNIELEQDEKGGSANKNQSISPRSFKEISIETAPSSSCEVGIRAQSVPEDLSNGRILETNADTDISMRWFETQNKEKSTIGNERDSKYGRLENYTSKSVVVDNEIHKERDCSVYGKHDRHDSRRSSRDRGWEGLDKRHGSRERGREGLEKRSGSRERGREGLEKRHDSRERGREGLDKRHSSRDGGKDVERCNSGYRDRDRDKSHISSRYDTRKDKHDSQYGEGGRGSEKERYSRRDREREMERDKSRDHSRESERIMNLRGDCERDRDSPDRGDRFRDRKTHSFSERDRFDQKFRDRRSNHDRQRDSRQYKYEDIPYRKEKIKGKVDTLNMFDVDEKQNSLREDDEVYQERIEQQLAKRDEEDIEKIKEESRKRKQAILEKYKKQENQQPVETSNVQKKAEELLLDNNGIGQQHKEVCVVSNTCLDEPVENRDPLDVYVDDPAFTVGKSPVQDGLSVPGSAACGLGEGSPKSERTSEMFCDDIFGESPAAVRKVGKDDFMKVDASGLHDNWDDAEGYYSYRLGEVLDGRYEVIAAHGKGVFSTVVRVKDLKAGKGDPEEVAIKIIRSNDTMYKAGMEELVILKKLAGADPEDKRHCVRFLSSFKYRNHLCLVFESLHMNLREVLKKFGRNIGLRLTAVRAYAKQLFIALKHLRNCGVLHCDIKPDNMLVNEAKNVLKLCDFGNAMFAGKNDITPYLVSRFYRAPEIILGLTYDHPLDIWSVGCCLFELYTGKVLFPGPSNNDMLRLHMELKGPFPKKMLRKGAFIDQHFDQDLNFHATEEDPVTKKTVKRLLLNIKPKDIGSLVSGSPGEDPKMLANFKDLLERVFVLDPEKRMTVSQALSHPFITGK